MTTPDDDTTPIELRWEGTVIHPAVPSEDDTIICCTTLDYGRPAAVFLDDEHREALGLQLVDPNGDDEQPTDLVAVPSEWHCSHGTTDDEPFCQELDEDEHPTCPTIRVHRDDAAQFAAMVEMVNELRSRMVATELLVERARDKGNDQISTDDLVDVLDLDQGPVR